LRKIFGAILALALILLPLAATASSQPTSYASQGAFAAYTGEGGFVAFNSGAVENITYTVTDVYSNGSMLLHVYQNITAGVDLPQTIQNYSRLVQVANPTPLPVVPIANLSTGHIFFQNISSSFIANNTASVPAGIFNTMEFSGKDQNNTVYNFWFDRNTGLLVEEYEGVNALELYSSNIATPVGPPSGLNGEVPYELVFVAAFAIGGGMFIWIRHHYGKAALKAATAKKGT
jgi:hypothetical protein